MRYWRSLVTGLGHINPRTMIKIYLKKCDLATVKGKVCYFWIHEDMYKSDTGARIVNIWTTALIMMYYNTNTITGVNYKYIYQPY